VCDWCEAALIEVATGTVRARLIDVARPDGPIRLTSHTRHAPAILYLYGHDRLALDDDGRLTVKPDRAM
jgi:hypothetical protein